MSMKSLLIAALTLLAAGLVFAQPDAVVQPGQGQGRGQRANLTAMLANAPVVTVEGTVQKIEQPAMGRAAGPVRAMLTTADGALSVVLSPAAYLTKIGLALKEGDKVKVTGWKVPLGQRTMLVTRQLVIGDNTYTFRDEKGNAAWENQLLTVTGTVKTLTTPAAGANGQPAPVICTLTTDQGDVNVSLAPQQRLTRLGLSLKEGDKVTVAGTSATRQEQQGIQAIRLTLGEKTYQLRDMPLQNAEKITVAGTIRRVQAGQAGEVRCVLANDKGSYLVTLAPSAYLTQIGLALKEGAQLSVDGWLVQGPQVQGAGQRGANFAGAVAARTVTADGKAYTLRDDTGKPAWNLPAK